MQVCMCMHVLLGQVIDIVADLGNYIITEHGHLLLLSMANQRTKMFGHQ